MVRKKIVNKLTLTITALLIAFLATPITNAIMTSLQHGWVMTAMFLIGSFLLISSYAYSNITEL